jgi:hypothetical protein
MQDGGVNNMADLTELYKTIAASAPDPLAWQKGLVGNYILQNEQLNLQEKQRQIAEEQRLRELFQRNQAPTAAELGAISPSFMQQYGKNQFDMMKQQSEMQNMQSQMTERVNKMAAGALGANADQYDADIASGMPPAMALNKFHTANGSAIRQLQESGLPIPPGSYDPESITPDAGHRAAQQFGIMTNRTKAELEGRSAEAQTYARGGAERRMGPMPSFEQRYGGVEMTPQGPMYKPPVPTMQPAEIPQGARSEALTDADIQMMQQQFQSLPNGSPEKVTIGAMLADAVKQRLPSGQFITPEQRQERERKAKVEETTAIEEAKSAAGKKETAETKVSTLETLPPIESINDLIDKSMSSGLEARVKGITSGEFGKQDESFTATAELQPIQAQIKGLAKSLVGAGAISDYEQKMMEGAAGAIADPRTPTEARKAALRVVYDINQKAIAKYPDLLQRLEQSKTASGPTIGTVQDGYRFKGGDPAQANNWEKVQ